MQDWSARLRKRARVDAADARGYNEENHGDNGMLSVTCARAVTHTIARCGFLRNAPHTCVYEVVDTGGTIAHIKGRCSHQLSQNLRAFGKIFKSFGKVII